ncbi:MAG TPA: TonB-dependent siderophore receptor [Terracidiphilus sp.]|jgi:iron complex outermembrane receptor protein
MHTVASNAGRSQSISNLLHRALAADFLFTVCLAFALPALGAAQASTQAAPQPLASSAVATQATGQQSSASGQSGGSSEPSSSASQPKPAPVTTTVIVHGELEDQYLPVSVTVGTLDGGELRNIPLSATVVTRDLLNDQVSRLLSDVIQNEASVEDDYVPVGYYGDYQIRGFPIDLATGIEINGMTIAGEQDVPLENKDAVEFLEGIAGVESGAASAGGLIDYVTKRPVNIQAVDLATDHRGTAYGAVDMGHLFGSRKQVGARVNLAGERIVPYMNDTNGWRAMGAGAADWKLNAVTIVKGDFEYQHKTERDGSGYQLLGGTTLPDINRIYRSTLLGDQPWSLPDTYDTFNTDARIERTISPTWLGFAAASLSHSLIQDNVIYAYGTPFDANGNVACPGAPDAPSYFFCPAVPGVSDGGDYGIYDYRNPGELRNDAEAEAMVTGHIKTGAIAQDVTAGGVIFLRSVQEPGFYTAAEPYSADGIVQDGAVYTYVGSENIYQPIETLPAPGDANSLEYPAESAGPRRLWEDSRQSSGVVQDRVHLPKRIQLIAGARYDSLRDHNYSAYASCTDPTDLDPATAPQPPNQNPCAPEPHDKAVWLPQFAVTYNPVENLTLYSNYGVTLSLGPQAPFWTDNGSQFLAPFFTRQAEVGAKYEPGQRILLTAALFHMAAPFFYPESDGMGGLNFVSQGRETHNGVELNAEGKAASWLRLNGSAAAMNAVSTATGTPAYDNKEVINVPHLHASLFADVTVPHLRNLHLMPGWSYTSRKEATRDDAVSVPSYNLFNLGARYTPGGEQGHIAFHIYADNITNKRYWSDAGASFGDTFVWLGAPPTVRLDAHYTF